MKSNRITAALAATALLAALLGCSSAPPAAQAPEAEAAPPAWVINPPESDAQYMYFTGSGGSSTGNLSEAEEGARGAVLDEIMRYLGVRVTSETTATARASLDSYQADVVQQLTSRSSGRVAGLEITEKWLDQRDSGVTVYLLARYDKADLLKEKRRLEEAFQERIQAISGPEQEAKSLESEGRLFEAALRYLDAAAAAFKSDLENAQVKYERNLNQAASALRRLSLVKLNDNLSTYAGEEFDQPFSLKVVDGSTEQDPGVPEAAIRVVYKVMRDSGKSAVRSTQLKTDAEGVLRFQLPAPEFVGKESVTMSLDIADALEVLQDVPEDLYSQVESLEQLAAKKSCSFSYESLSMAAVVPTGVAVFDLDASGSPIALTETSAGLLERLSQAQYHVVSLAAAVTNIVGRSDAQVTSFLKSNFQGQVRRVIFGSASISDHTQDKDYAIIQVTGTLKVVDLETGQILLAVNKSKRAQGTSTAAALSAAFKKLGEDLGDAVINELR
jgi:hypothetical protein